MNNNVEKNVFFASQRRSSALLKDAIVVDGHGDTPPLCKLAFNATGSDLQIYLDRSRFMQGFETVGWMPPRRSHMRLVGRYARGEEISLPIMEPTERHGSMQWRWCIGDSAEGDRDLIHAHEDYQGRMVLIGVSGEEEHISFLVQRRDDAAKAPKVLGEHMFTFGSAWHA